MDQNSDTARSSGSQESERPLLSHILEPGWLDFLYIEPYILSALLKQINYPLFAPKKSRLTLLLLSNSNTDSVGPSFVPISDPNARYNQSRMSYDRELKNLSKINEGIKRAKVCCELASQLSLLFRLEWKLIEHESRYPRVISKALSFPHYLLEQIHVGLRVLFDGVDQFIFINLAKLSRLIADWAMEDYYEKAEDKHRWRLNRIANEKLTMLKSSNDKAKKNLRVYPLIKSDIFKMLSQSFYMIVFYQGAKQFLNSSCEPALPIKLLKVSFAFLWVGLFYSLRFIWHSIGKILLTTFSLIRICLRFLTNIPYYLSFIIPSRPKIKTRVLIEVNHPKNKKGGYQFLLKPGVVKHWKQQLVTSKNPLVSPHLTNFRETWVKVQRVVQNEGSSYGKFYKIVQYQCPTTGYWVAYENEDNFYAREQIELVLRGVEPSSETNWWKTYVPANHLSNKNNNEGFRYSNVISALKYQGIDDIFSDSINLKW